ncbi:MAG TPA: SPOR domain-containing protein [Allosphingosinicella sp.]|uniref:SPOR domain-containing protein n=1 Tax=Allosphingosinicella sp. TaxID=2823234 RepID=UPI002ED7C2B8
MSDMRADEDRLPWLEPVEEEAPASHGPSMGKVLGLVLLGLVLLGAVVGGYSWWSQQGATEGTGELIAAPATPYKVAPDDPGGMDVEGEGDTAFAASEGAEPQGRIDMSAVPEAPVAMPPRQKEEVGPPPPEKGPEGASREGAPPQVTPPPRAVAGGGTIQLGAFSSEASANAAWKALFARFKYLQPLSYSVVPVKSGDKTLYRLRASGPDAAGICGRLNIAGETCVRVN